MSFFVVSDPHVARVVAFDAVYLDADGEVMGVDLTTTVPEAVGASGAWIWVKVNVEPSSPLVSLSFGDALVPSYSFAPGSYPFSLFVPLQKGVFNIHAIGNGATINVTVYPQAIH